MPSILGTPEAHAIMAQRLVEPEFFGALLDEIDEGVCFTDRDERVLYWNKAAERITGYGSQDVVGRMPSPELLQDANPHGCELCTKGCPLRSPVKENRLRSSYWFIRHREGHRVPVRVRTMPLLDRHGHGVGEARLFSRNGESLACVEKLTQLRELTLVDGLEEVNRARGQAAGDAALRVVAATLQGVLRSFDVLARWGDGEYLAVVEKLSIQSLSCLAERMRDLVGASVVPAGRLGGGEEFGVTVCVGGTGVWEGDSLGRLVGRAEWRLRQAKSEGRGSTVVV